MEVGPCGNGLVINSSFASDGEFLLGLSAKELEQWAQLEGESAFRGRQIHDWLYKKGVKNIEEITVLPKEWRFSLRDKGFKVGRLKENKRLIANDKTMIKLLNCYSKHLTVKILRLLGSLQRIA